MDRLRLNFTPVFGGTLVKWMRTVAEAQAWRTRPYLDTDDLMQEGYLLFHKLVERYPRVDSPQHFGALMRTSFHRMIVSAARSRMRRREYNAGVGISHSDDMGEAETNDLLALMAADDEAMTDVITLMEIEDAPKWIRRLAGSVTHCRRNGYALYRRTRGQRETTTERLCRVLNAKPVGDAVAAVKQWVIDGETPCIEFVKA